MKYCHNCGKQLEDMMNFCPSCGQEQSMHHSVETSTPVENPRTDKPAGRHRHLHCPNCKSTNIMAALESQVTDGGALHIPIGNGLGISSFTGETHQRYDWLCQNCGIRFPNIYELEKKISAIKIVPPLTLVLIILSLVGMVYYLLKGLTNSLFIPISCFIFFSAIHLYARKEIASQTNLILYYKERCFD
jgi:hypothetical protein